jgi:hypothetical protein
MLHIKKRASMAQTNGPESYLGYYGEPTEWTLLTSSISADYSQSLWKQKAGEGEGKSVTIWAGTLIAKHS